MNTVDLWIATIQIQNIFKYGLLLEVERQICLKKGNLRWFGVVHQIDKQIQ